MKYFFSVLCAAQVLILFSCAGHQDALEIKETRYFISVLQKGTLTPQHFLSYDEVAPYAETIEKYAGFILKDLTAETVIINYRTTDFYGNPIVASGSIVYPTRPNDVRMTFEFPGIAHVLKSGGPSGTFPNPMGLPAFFGYITLIPDLIGYGVTTDYVHPFLMPEITGKVAADFRLAAKEYLKTVDISLPEETVIGSYSYGANVGLALAKYYQLHDEYNVKIDKVFLGGGCYDPRAAFDGFAASGKSGYPILPFIVMSMDYYYDLHLNYQNIFYGILAEHYPDWCDGYHSKGFLTNTLGTDMHQYLHPDFFTKEKNADLNRLYDYLALNSHVDGWTPEMPVYFYHSTEDDYVPFECAAYAYEQFKKRGAYVRLIKGTGSHSDFALRFVADVAAYLLIK